MFLEALTLQSPIALWMQQLFSLEVSLAGIPILSNGLQFKAAVKSAQKIPYSSVGFGLGTWRAEKNTSNSQCLVNISKAERMVQEGGILTLWSLGSMSLAVLPPVAASSAPRALLALLSL